MDLMELDLSTIPARSLLSSSRSIAAGKVDVVNFPFSLIELFGLEFSVCKLDSAENDG